MTASAIALPFFPATQVLLATDETDGVHTLQVTTDAPTSAIAFVGPNAVTYRVGTVEADGVHTVCVSEDAADTAMQVWVWGGNLAVINMLDAGDGVMIFAVTQDTPDNGIPVPAFNNDYFIAGTVYADGRHTLCLADAVGADTAVAIWSWNLQKAIIAAVEAA